MKNSINWFEIPVKDFTRAKKFYEAVLGTEMQTMDGSGDGGKMAFFPSEMMEGGVGGGIVEGEGYEPSKTGTIVYLNGGEDLSIPLSKVEGAGGKITMPKTGIGEHGQIAKFIDTEGNQVAFHSMK